MVPHFCRVRRCLSFLWGICCGASAMTWGSGSSTMATWRRRTATCLTWAALCWWQARGACDHTNMQNDFAGSIWKLGCSRSDSDTMQHQWQHIDIKSAQVTTVYCIIFCSFWLSDSDFLILILNSRILSFWIMNLMCYANSGGWRVYHRCRVVVIT